jgi:transcriptional regulator with XRE-family HTH domain
MWMKVSDANEFGNELRKRRKKLNYIQQFLADFTGLSVSFISDLENGKETAELGKALYVANTLGLDVNLNER